MRSLEDARARWQATTSHLTSLKDLKKSVKLDGTESPSIAGLRSVCWKTFLLFQNTNTSEWPQALTDSRSAYSSLRGHLLRFIENPDELGTSLDPLDDDRNSPWNTLRQDDEMRAEIFQDVERCMPEEPYFRQPETQRMLLDILFVFCKINQDVGYRQGMHELLAPILWVIDQDSVDAASDTDKSSDSVMKQTLDQRYVEHDAFTLLSLVMRSAKSFYELGEPEKRVNGLSPQQQGASPIVERSKRIHEVYLASVDPELARHLTDIEVLPQIFLIRWIRLLFGREFPFEDILALWDTLFAEDPGLDMIDLVCVAMLLRIRWQLMESNYSFALMLLLKYPPPSSPHGPKTFVDDATFLRENLTPVGGAAIIEKYSDRSPPLYSPSSPPATPSAQSSSPRQSLQRTKSPLPSPARFLQQQGVGDLFQGAARGLLDRGERLGINQAVRDAVGEAKKNMQGLQASRNSSFMGRTPSENSRWSLDEGKRMPSAHTMVSTMNVRNQKLASMLDQAMSDLRAASVSKSDDKHTYVQAMDLAIAKVEFVRIYLEDSTMPLPMEDSEAIPSSPVQQAKILIEPAESSAEIALPTTQNPTDQVVAASTPPTVIIPPETPIKNHTTKPEPGPNPASPAIITPLDLPQSPITEPRAEKHLSARPIPLPTRSTIAQSNFAWMLEPDESSSSGSKSPPKSASPFLKSSTRRPTSGASREKAAFLFGEDGGDSSSSSPRFPPLADIDEGFNMGTIKGSKSK